MKLKLIQTRHWTSIPWLEILPYMGFALIVFGAKLMLITHFANATPYWDQWDAEADKLYRPWLEGTLSLSDVFDTHNEHRIVLTRLLSLALLAMNGCIWDPILQMQLNSGLHVMALCVLLYFISKDLTKISQCALLVFSAVIFSIPFGWENTLAGFQSQFYFLLLLSFVFLWAISRYVPYTPMWWLGLMFGFLSVFSLASGALGLLAGTILLLFRSFYEDDHPKPVFAIVTLLFTAIVAIVLTPSIPAHYPFKAQSPVQFIKALATAAGWPTVEVAWLVIQAPLLLFMFHLLLGSLSKSACKWFIFAVGLWLFGQFTSLAYGRAVATLSSRYQDILAIGLVLNFACILFFLGNATKPSKTRYGFGAATWLVFVALGFSSYSGKMADDLDAKAQQGLYQEQNVRAYLVSRDVADLADKPFLHVPYPNSERLKSFLDNRIIQQILPGNIAVANSHRRPSLIKRILNNISSVQVHLVSTGVTLLLLSLLLSICATKNSLHADE